MSDVIHTLATIVDIPSVTGNEGRLCTYLAQRLEPTWGMAGVVRINNSLVVGHRTGKPMLALVGHLDTVPEQGQGGARVADGRMHGLGTTDMKSGLAVMLHLLEDPAVKDGPFDVIGVFYEAEEGPMSGNGLEEVLVRAPWLRGTELAIVLEPTSLQIEVGCQGVVNARVTFLGDAGHSARPWLGENAVTKAGEWLARLHAMEFPPIRVDGYEFRPVFSVTTAHGGVAHNIIPGRFDINLNHRFAPDQTVEEAVAALQELAADADEVEIKDTAPAGPVAQSPHLDRLAKVTGAEFHSKLGWTDVARLEAHGIPAVNYGPGEPQYAHRVNESVSVEYVERSLVLLTEFLTSP